MIAPVASNRGRGPSVCIMCCILIAALVVLNRLAPASPASHVERAGSTSLDAMLTPEGYNASYYPPERAFLAALEAPLVAFLLAISRLLAAVSPRTAACALSLGHWCPPGGAERGEAQVIEEDDAFHSSSGITFKARECPLVPRASGPLVLSGCGNEAAASAHDRSTTLTAGRWSRIGLCARLLAPLPPPPPARPRLPPPPLPPPPLLLPLLPPVPVPVVPPRRQSSRRGAGRSSSSSSRVRVPEASCCGARLLPATHAHTLGVPSHPAATVVSIGVGRARGAAAWRRREGLMRQTTTGLRNDLSWSGSTR